MTSTISLADPSWRTLAFLTTRRLWTRSRSSLISCKNRFARCWTSLLWSMSPGHSFWPKLCTRPAWTEVSVHLFKHKVLYIKPILLWYIHLTIPSNNNSNVYFVVEAIFAWEKSIILRWNNERLMSDDCLTVTPHCYFLLTLRYKSNDIIIC